MDRAAITLGDQAWQQPAVIEVGMGDHHRIQLPRVEGEGAAVLILLLAAPLVHAALEQDLGAVATLHQVAGAGNLLDCTEKSKQGHGSVLVVMMWRVCRFEASRGLMQVTRCRAPGA